MAAVTMAASSLAAFVAAPLNASASYSGISSVRMAAPLNSRRRLSVVAMSQNETKKTDLNEKISEAIAYAQKACEEDPTSAPCAVSWDDVEELSAAAAHQKASKKQSDPLEEYCADNPETDECRVYED